MEASKKEKSGYLEKWTNYVGGYQKRWVVVSSGAISYYIKKEEPRCRGRFSLARFYLKNGEDCTFTLAISEGTQMHVLDLKAKNHKEKGEWMEVLLEAKKNGSMALSDAASRLREGLLSAENKRSQSTVKKYLKKINIFDDKEKKIAEPQYISQLAGDVQTALGIIEKEQETLLQLQEAVFELKKKEKVLLRKYKELWRALEERQENPDVSSYEQMCQEMYVLSTEDLEAREDKDVFYDLDEGREEASVETVGLRACLPARSVDVPKAGLFKIIKNAIGKDITRTPLPINFSEPLSFLQRMCEDMEYSALLDTAAKEDDPERRMLFVAAFAISGYSSTQNRLTKPFNPLLGETFELCDMGRGFRYISEQVSHHPLVSACHCDSENYQYCAETGIAPGFNGKSVSVSPQGYCNVYFKKWGEHYYWKKAKSSVNNVIFGNMWIEHHGKIEIQKNGAKERCILELLHSGSKEDGDYQRIEGVLICSEESEKYTLDGSWGKGLSAVSMDGERILLWEAVEKPPESSEYYNFTSFAMQLNMLSDMLRKMLCGTDSRFRPDQRAMENGKWELSSELKVLLEKNQRLRRKALEKNGGEYHPRWFTLEEEPDTGHSYWKYNGEYWALRGNWGKTVDIFDCTTEE
eukprot:GHVN01009746.1.p1 GENE.GHVN01009746.1~~GHVN01009746.1.p1  ORF type:complete len:636 (-),score=70.64 GHVN01009746.1:1802-3709(-)